MPVTSPSNLTPDVDQFKARHRVFQVVDNGLVTLIIQEAVDQIGDASRWCNNSYPRAIMLLAAHTLIMEGEPERSIEIAESEGDEVVGGVQTGNVSKVKVGDVETTFDSATSARGQIDAQSLRNLVGDQINYSLTHYGREYLKLRQKNFGGPRVFTCP